MDNLFKRGALAFGFFWLGLHMIGLAMIDNGSNRPWNPTWRFISAIFAIEYYLGITVIIAILCIFILSLIEIFTEKKTEKLMSENINLEATKHFSDKPKTETKETKDTFPEMEKPVVKTPRPQKPKEEVQKPIEKSPEELKAEAIRQLTKGW